MNKVKLYWSIQFGSWTLFALLQIMGFHLLGNNELTFYQIIFWFIESSLFFIITHFFRFFIIRYGWLELSIKKLIPKVIFSVVILGLLIYVLRVIVSVPLDIFEGDIIWKLSNVIGLSLVYSLILFLWILFYFIYHYFERHNISLKRQAVMNEIELNSLKSQLNPHFIFNSLNSIRALVEENPTKSKKSITQLSNILRSSLTVEKKSLIPFSDEFKVVKDYLALELIRFEDRLMIRYDIHPFSNTFLIPPLMLQTIVENGVKYGVSRLKEGGLLEIKTYLFENNLVIQIKNSGYYTEEKNTDKTKNIGLGIINTKQRLELIYGDKAVFSIRNEKQNMVVAKLIIPKI